ncbi:MAG: tetratricopeptide repeat protein [Caldilineaceae bacterium]
MTRVDIGPTLLQKELKEAQNRLAQKPERWVGHEKVGRVLHWMGDPSAKDYLKKAAHIRIKILRPGRVQGWELMAIANYYRLAGEAQLAKNYFERAYEMLKAEVGDLNNPEEINLNPMQHLVMACFLLGRYEESIVYGKIYREDNPNPNLKLLAHRFTELAEAKISKDVTKAERAIDTIAAGIRSTKGKVQSTGIITSWDAYELGLEVLAEIEANNQLS